MRRSTGGISLPEISTPSTPPSGFGGLYFKTDGNLYKIDDAGVEVMVATVTYVDDEIVALDEIDGTPGIGLDTGTTGFVKPYRRGEIVRSTVAAVANTTTETSLWRDSPWETAANRLSLLHRLRFQASGGYLNNSGSNKDVTFRLKTGTDAVFALTFSAIPTNATSRPWLFDITVLFTDFIGTRAQSFGTAQMGAASSTGGAVFQTSLIPASSPVVDFTNIINWDFTVQHSAAASTVTAQMASHCVIVEDILVEWV